MVQSLSCFSGHPSPPMHRFLWSSRWPWSGILLSSFSDEETMGREPYPKVIILRNGRAGVWTQISLTQKPMSFAWRLQVSLLLIVTLHSLHSPEKRQSWNCRQRWRSSGHLESPPVKFLIWDPGLSVVHHGCVLVLICTFMIGKWNSAHSLWPCLPEWRESQT